MKSNLFTLVKTDLRETLDFRKFKENKGKSTSFIVIISLAIIGGMVLSTLYSLMFSFMFKAGNANLVYSTLFMAGFASILTFSTSVFKTKSIFVGKDYEMLSSMPIKKSTIIASKIINLYLIELIYACIVMLPNMVINAIISGNFLFIISGLVITVLVPAIPMALSVLFALFLALVADRFRFGNIINVFLYLILFVCIFFFSFSMNSTGRNVDAEGALDISNMVNMATYMSYLNPALLFVKMAHINNYLFIFVFAAIEFVVLALVIFLVALLHDPIYESISSFKSNNIYVRKELKVEGQEKALLKNEFKRYFKSKFYFINTFCGGIAAIVCGGIMAYMFSPYAQSATEEFQQLEPFIHDCGFIGALIIIFMIGIATPASCGISFEGKTFWLIKSLPINVKAYLKSKIILSTVVLSVCSLVASTLIVVFIQPSIFSIILIYVLPIIYIFAASVIGLIINLSFYKLKWKTEQECCKQSAGVVISMLVDFAISIVLGLTAFGLAMVNPYLGGLATLGILVVLGIVSYIVLMKVGERRIANIEEF